MGARATYLTGGGNPIQGFDRMSISSSAGLGVLDLHGTFDTEVPGESCSVSAFPWIRVARTLYSVQRLSSQQLVGMRVTGDPFLI